MQTLLESLLKTAAVAVAGAKEFAPGIPADKRKSPIPRVPRFGPPTTYIYTAQGHEAVKSGLHTDLRLSDGSKAYSWAVRKGIPMIPGEKVLAVRQPDHCFPPGTLVDTPAGPRPIESLQPGDLVYSMAVDGSRVVRKILRVFKNEASELVSFHVRNGKRGGTVLCTGGHEIFTDRGKIQASMLTTASRPLMMGKRLSSDQLSVLLGTLLGDGSAAGGRVRIGHGERQEPYTRYLVDVLEAKFLTDHLGKPWAYVYGDEVRELVKDFSFRKYEDGWFDLVGPRGLAILFCDDGSCTLSGKRQHLWIELSVQCYSVEEIASIQAWLARSFRIDSVMIPARHDSRWHKDAPTPRKLYRLRVYSRASVARFLQAVAPYVPYCMAYKLPSAESVVRSKCLCCGRLIRRARKVCSECLWNDAAKKGSHDYSPLNGGLVWSRAVYERFGCWPSGEYPGGHDDSTIYDILTGLDCHTRGECQHGYIGAVTGVVRRSPRPVRYSGPVHNFEVEETHNYVLASGLIVGNSHAYASFEGQLTSGYGRTKGRGVWIEEQGPSRIVYADEEKIRFTLVSAQNPRQYTMIRQGGDSWLLINTTPTPASRPNVPQSKPKYKEADPSEFDKYLTDGSRTAVTAKLDGGHVTLNFDKESPEVYSYRPSERQTGLLDHTFLMGLEKTRTPNSLRGIRVRGDLYAVDKDGKAVPNRIVSGLMNSSPQVGRDKALAEDLKLRIGIHDVVTGPKGKPMESAPWGDKLEILKKVVQKLKDDRLHLPQMAVTPEAQKKLFESIRDKTNKTTDEGVVVWRMDQAGAPIKIKFRDHRQVYFHTAYQGSGSLNGTLGSFSYSLTPSGPEVGTVGTGFDDAEREWIWKSRNTLKGRKVVIKSDEQFPSGAYRAPSYDHFHD